MFYAVPRTWNCFINASDVVNFDNNTDPFSAEVRSVLGVEVDTSVAIDFRTFKIGDNTTTTDETIEVLNAGNILINITLKSFGSSEGDGLSMIYTNGTLQDINLKYT